MGLACLVLALPSALSQGASPFFSDFLGSGVDFLTAQNNLWGNYSLTIGALLLCIFVGWVWGVDKSVASMESSGHLLKGHQLYGFLLRYICPIAVLVVLSYILRGNYF